MCVLCFDSAYSLRKEIYPEYKSKRREKPLPDAERFVVDCVKDAAAILRCNHRALGFQSCAAYGYEADDCIAVNATYLTPRVCRVIILTSDHDIFQCVANNVFIATPVGGALIDADGVREETGVSPDQIAEFKSLAGCKSDDIPGIKGIGEQTAANYLCGREIGEHRKKLIENADPFQLAMWRLLVKLPFKDKDQANFPQPIVSYDNELHPVKHEGWLEELARDSGVNEDEFISLSVNEMSVPEPEPM
jgi:5'-3' exonuclease